jgi:hypothetical protein
MTNPRPRRPSGVRLRCPIEGFAAVPRLATAALIAWLALLGGVAPAIACASQVSDDCCPAAPADPCPEQAPRPETGASFLCCPAVPGTSALVGSPFSRAEPASQPDSGDPDRDALSVADLRLGVRPAGSAHAAAPSHSPVPDGRAIYLHTGRLRR